MKSKKDLRKLLHHAGDRVVILAVDENGVERAYPAVVSDKGNTGPYNHTGSVKVGAMFFSSLTGEPIEATSLKEHIRKIIPMANGDPTAYSSASQIRELLESDPISRTSTLKRQPRKTDHKLARRNEEILEGRIAAQAARVEREQAELLARGVPVG
jgi:hypothetical protein